MFCLDIHKCNTVAPTFVVVAYVAYSGSQLWLVHFQAWHDCRYTPEAEKDASRRWRDGSLEEDLPMRTLSEMFNVNYFLVSQTNPHIVPALNMKRKFNRKLGNLLETEWKHR